MTSIYWSGYNWNVKVGTGLAPGPNNWSDDPSDVYVDSQGGLHLKISNKNGLWYCTEIISTDTFGYGIYTFNVAPINYLDTNAVLGMFTYADDCHEIDIEYSKWGNSNNTTDAGFTVQPLEACTSPYGNIYNQYNNHKFNIPLNNKSVNTFIWSSSSVSFSNVTSSTPTIWSSSGYVPQSPTTPPTNVRINLWLYQGNSPQSPTEVIINSFKFSNITTYDCVSGICQPLAGGTFSEPTCGGNCISVTSPPFACPPDKINILKSCISRDLLLAGGAGAILLMMLVKS